MILLKFGFILVQVISSSLPLVNAYAPVDIKLDEKAKQTHRIDSLNILAYTFLLILTVCTIWLFKTRRAKFVHETGLAIFYGLIVGAIIRYVGDSETSYTHLKVIPTSNTKTHVTTQPSITGTTTELATSTTLAPVFPSMPRLPAPPDSVWVPLQIEDKNHNRTSNKTYVYIFKGELNTEAESAGSRYISQKATFDPEVFFNIILPPIIFHAGYSLKRRFFFRNLGNLKTFY